MIELKPFGKAVAKEIKFSTFDIESREWILEVCSSAAWRDCFGNLHGKSFKNIYEYLDFCFSSEHPCDFVYMHGGGIFDFDFILGPIFELYEEYFFESNIQRTNGFLLFKVAKIERIPDGCTRKISEKRVVVVKGKRYKKVRSIEFRDSSALLPFSLENLARDFDVEHKKITSVDRSNIKEATKEVLEYNLYDCYALLEVLEKFVTWPLIRKVGISSTMAGQALKVFRTYIDVPIRSLSEATDEFIRRGYFGGRTEIFKCLFEAKNNESLFYYDYNSLYPYCMLEEMPIKEAKGKIKTIDQIKKYMGFVDCTVEVPETYVPPLPAVLEINKTNKLVFPTGTFRGVFSTIELKYAMEQGVEVLEIHDSIKFKSGGKIFKKYILDMYKMRKESPKVSVTNVLCKLLMNSLYGRWGLNKEREELVINPPDITGMTYHSCVETVHGRLEFFISPKFLDKSFTNVAVAAWVTSLARIHLHKTLNKHHKDIYYCDTDSILLSKDLKTDSEKLGQLKKEFSAKKAVFVLPKTYLLDDADGKLKKVVAMKGFEKKLVQKFTFEDFHGQLEGEAKLYVGPSEKKAKLRSALKKGSFLAMKYEEGRSIKAVYDKRAYICNSENYDTSPLHIVNGKVSNLDGDIQSREAYKNKMIEKALLKDMND